MSGVFDGQSAVKSYDRGSYVPIIAATAATNTPANAATLPVGSNVYGIAPSVSNDQQPGIYAFQIDAVGTPAAVVTAYGSLDGISFYSLGALQSSGTYGLAFIVDKKVRYITAAVTTYGGNGTTDTVAVGMVI